VSDIMETIEINNFMIKKNSRPFIVGEVGINHNGDLTKAFEMIEVAKQSGLNAIKFQTFKAQEFCGDPSQTYTYKSQGKEVTESMLEMFSRYEFSKNEWKQIKQKCVSEGITFLSTPQNFSDLKLLLELGIDAIKVGSDDFTNIPLLKKYSSTNLPLIVSSGMSTLEEVNDALDAIGYFSGYPVILLVTTSQYPTPNEDVNLLKFHTLSKKFPNLLLGFSDHTIGNIAATVACGMGSVFFEKHFTLDCDLDGPDHWFSANPQQLKSWRNSIISSFEMLGSPEIKPTKNEIINKNEFRRYIVAKKSIMLGELFSNENIELKRISGGNGLSGKFFEILLKTKSNRNYKKGEKIQI
tara:strand:+ start:1973 stop:3031 length:1059 start_codon:yes stop_codon:yes gene_type:complete